MRISNKFCTTQNVFRYCSSCTLFPSLFPKTLNPKTWNIVLASNSVITISSLSHSSSGSSLFFSFESCWLQKRPFISISSCGSSPVFRFGLHSSICFSNPHLPTKNRLLIESSSGFSARCKIELYSRRENVSLCYFSAGRPSKMSSFSRSFLMSWCSLALSTHNSPNVCSNSGCFHGGNMVRCYTLSSSSGTSNFDSAVGSEVQSVANVCSEQPKLEERNNFLRKFVSEIVNILRNNGEDLEFRLNMLHSRLSVYSIAEIFEVLNSQRISGLRFFEWIRSNIPQLYKNGYVCSLIIDNLGRLDDYETMYTWLKKFTSEKICLTSEAFRFLGVLASTDSSLEESTKRVVDLLNTVGGSCRNSGVCALIEMFCKFHLFKMARYVIRITESKSSYYCLLIREKCRSGCIEDAYKIIREMAQAHCAPNTTMYNYLLGSLWKNGRMDEASALLDEMKENGIPSDAITFEILINSACSLGNMDVVQHLLDQMRSQGLEPRLSTHACIIKSLFAAEKYEAAHKHVVDASIIYRTSSNMVYSLMANLYWEKGDIMSAGNTLVEMMEKSLKPNFSIYIKIVKQLRRIGRLNLARDLESRHSKFAINMDFLYMEYSAPPPRLLIFQEITRIVGVRMLI